MALQTVISFFAPDLMKCYAKCNKTNYQDLVVTKCSHIFCRDCLKASLASKKECPIDRTTLLDMDSEEGKKEYTSFQLHLERFTHYIIHDSATLKQKLEAEKVLRITSCEQLKADNVQKNSSSVKGGDVSAATSDYCSICLATPFQMYFIMSDKNSNKVGYHMHEGCWQDTIENKSDVLDISVQNLVKVAKQLPHPKVLPQEPIKPPSPIKVFFMAIVLPVSLWALAMNTRIYHSKSFVLFVLSIPALIIFKVLSLILNGLKAVFTVKPI